jgi:hypothetical protein
MTLVTLGSRRTFSIPEAATISAVKTASAMYAKDIPALSSAS